MRELRLEEVGKDAGHHPRVLDRIREDALVLTHLLRQRHLHLVEEDVDDLVAVVEPRLQERSKCVIFRKLNVVKYMDQAMLRMIIDKKEKKR